MKNNLINIDTIKKGDTTMYNQKVNNDETLKRVQGDGRPACTTKVAAKGGQVRSYTSKVSEVSKMSKQGEQQSLHSLRPMGEGGRRPDEGLKETGRPACTTTQVAAKAARSTEKNTLAPCGRGQNLLANECELRNSGEGSYQCDKTDMTPHQVRTKLAKRSLSPTILSPSGEELRDVTRHSATEPKNVKDLTSYRLNVLTSSTKAAFTLAEVLITLAVIGIVAALTLPGLIQNHNEKAWSTAKDLWEKKLTETVRRMNTDGVMTGHDSTEDFMDTFKQYMKVIKTCDHTDINKCYSPKVVTTGKNDDPMEIETDSLTSASSMGLKEWQTNTNTMSFVVADGTTVIMAYQPECPYADPIEDQGSQVSCMAYMVDVNGKKGPNRVGKDIQLSSGVAFSTCDNPIGDMCWSTEFQANRAINTCAGSEYADLEEMHGAYCDINYWAGAKLTCQEKNMTLPTRAQLAQLASNLYVDSEGNAVTIGANENKDNLKVKDEYKDNPPITLDYPYWSSEEYNASYAYCREFGITYSYGSFNTWPRKYDSYILRAVCISN